MTENKTTKREQQTQKMNQLVHELVQKIDRNPEEPQNYYDLATVLVDGNDYEQAEELLMKALGLFDNAEVTVKDKLIYGLANVYYAAEEYPKAIQWFEKITSQQLKTDAYLMLAQSYLALGDNKRSMAFALTAQGKQTMKPEISNLIGDNLLALGDFEQAGSFYDQTLAVDPNNGPANFNRGLVAMVQAEPYAIYFDKAKKTDPDYFQKSQQKLTDIEKFLKTKQE